MTNEEHLALINRKKELGWLLRLNEDKSLRAELDGIEDKLYSANVRLTHGTMTIDPEKWNNASLD